MKAFLQAALQKWNAHVGRSVNKLDFKSTYTRHVRSLKRLHSPERAMQLAVGGEFHAIGLLELAILRHYGLPAEGSLIDVGCGSGRLAQPLSQYLKGSYLGIDVIPELVEHAKRITARPDWRFDVSNGIRIPAADAQADMVCFFSVFTHLLHEQTYAYLQEAKRALKPGGTIVFSFLEFSIPSHWSIFEHNVRDLDINANHLNMFLGRDGIKAWAEHLQLEVFAIEDGDKAFIPLEQPITFENGNVAKDYAALGQSVCALRKPRHPEQ